MERKKPPAPSGAPASPRCRSHTCRALEFREVGQSE